MEELTLTTALEQADAGLKRINEAVMPPFDDPDDGDDDDEDDNE